jgi:hypothetical protein
VDRASGTHGGLEVTGIAPERLGARQPPRKASEASVPERAAKAIRVLSLEVPLRAQQSQARMPPARLHGIQNRARNRARSRAEQQSITMAVTILAAAQIGTSGARAISGQARRQAARATPRTGVLGTVTSTHRGCRKQA